MIEMNLTIIFFSFVFVCIFVNVNMKRVFKARSTLTFHKFNSALSNWNGKVQVIIDNEGTVKQQKETRSKYKVRRLL